LNDFFNEKYNHFKFLIYDPFEKFLGLDFIFKDYSATILSIKKEFAILEGIKNNIRNKIYIVLDSLKQELFEFFIFSILEIADDDFIFLCWNDGSDQFFVIINL